MDLDPIHFTYLKACFPEPPEQGAIGFLPRQWLKEFEPDQQALYSAVLARCPGGGAALLTREKVPELCLHPEVDALSAYALVMAWGSRNPWNFQLSVSRGASRGNLVDLIEYLRGSEKPVEEDFRHTSAAARSIAGLGISFFTKLLFFFRKKQDACILDQWTAKAVKLLFRDCRVRLSGDMPAANTSDSEYAWYGEALDWLGPRLGTPEKPWTREEVERAIFDRPGGIWRRYVRSFYPDGAGAEPPAPPEPPREDTPGLLTGRPGLARRIKAAHETAAAGSDMLLPSSTARVMDTNPVSVYCRGLAKIRWEYLVQVNSVLAKILFLGERGVEAYKALRRQLNPEGHGWGEGIKCNGHNEKGRARAIWVRVEPGAGAPGEEWNEIAVKSVDAMNYPHERVGQFLLFPKP